MTVIETDDAPLSDMLYGQILPPEIYAFHLTLGLQEPELMLRTQAAFVYGTQFRNWAGEGRSWVQPFQQPLPVWQGVPLPKLVARLPGVSLQDVMISAQAARKGAFAHPPEDPDHPLSRAEYGYAVDPAELTAVYRSLSLKRTLTVIRSDTVQIGRDGNHITEVTLDDGQTVRADFYIDATGPDASLSADRQNDLRTLVAKISRNARKTPPKSAREIFSFEAGWQSRLGMGDDQIIMSVSDREGPELDAAHNDPSVQTIAFPLGRNGEVWIGNHAALGHAAGGLEPISVAPMIQLMRDVERLIALFPLTTDMRIEAREYNRASGDDFLHAEIFNQAHFALTNTPEHPYWRTAAKARHAKLNRKLTQYDARGHLVDYDKEPFDTVAWAALHDGMGRAPRRADPLALQVDADALSAQLTTMRRTIGETVAKMPPEPVYREKFRAYLKRKFG